MSTILVTDVPPPIRRFLGRLLEAEGHVCVFAGDGEDALRMVRDGRPDLALIDVEMPRRSGLEVLAALRQDAETRATRVILTCAGARLAAADAELVASADDFVTKPFERAASRIGAAGPHDSGGRRPPHVGLARQKQYGRTTTGTSWADGTRGLGSRGESAKRCEFRIYDAKVGPMKQTSTV